MSEDAVISLPQKVPLKAHYDVSVTFMAVGPQCSAFITSKGLMFASGKNHTKRLLLRESTSHIFMPCKVPAPVAQVAFTGKGHTVLLQSNGQILTLSKGLLKEVRGLDSNDIQCVSAFDAGDGGQKGLCVTKEGHVFNWNMTNTEDFIKAEKLGFDSQLVSENCVNLSVSKNHFIIAYKK